MKNRMSAIGTKLFIIVHILIFAAIAIPKNTYPVRLGYVYRIFQWFPVQKLAAGLGVPGYTDQKIYNYVSLSFWKCGDIPTQAALVWSKPIDYFGDDSVFGKTKTEIQQNLKKKYSDGKVQVLVTAFGPEKPTSQGYNWQDCANNLASFVLQNNLDGCDISWQDSNALQNGSGEKWLINFHTHLRKLIPNHTIIHSPFAGYFNQNSYKNGSYLGVNTQINKTLNFYNIKYYNQGISKYTTYQDIFIQSTGLYSNTSVQELVKSGIDVKKIIVGKPGIPSDITGTGWIDATLLGQYISRANEQFGWFGGAGLWQYSSDVKGKMMSSAVGHLKEVCAISKNCK